MTNTANTNGLGDIYNSTYISLGTDVSSVLSTSTAVSNTSIAMDTDSSLVSDGCIANTDTAVSNVVVNTTASSITTVPTSGSTTVTDSTTGTSYEVSTTNGLSTLQEIANAGQFYSGYSAISDTTVTSDNTDYLDYLNRYSSIDAKFYRENGSDIAFMRIITNDTNRTVIFPALTTLVPGITANKFKQFIVSQFSISHKERMQLVETNSDYQALFFGKKPEILQISGILKNTVDNPWTINMIFFWDNLMRGTTLVENGYICQLFIDGELFEGYPFSFDRSKVAGSDNVTNFIFGFLIKTRTTVTKYGGTLNAAS
jgi:hypothetical protein